MVLRSLSNLLIRNISSNVKLPTLNKALLVNGVNFKHLAKPTSVCSYCTQSNKTKQSQTDDLEHCNVGTIGHVDHGKTTLTAAITKVLSQDGRSTFTPFDKIDTAPEERHRGITINTAHVGYKTAKRSYAHTDCPGHMDFVKNMIAGTSQMDAAIIVVAATDGQMPQTKEHLMLANRLGLKKIVVFVNKCDVVDQDMRDLVEIEMRELLSEYGFDGDNSPVVFGSALQALEGNKESEFGEASIHRLMDALDEHAESPKRDLKAPFYLPIDNFVSVPHKGCVMVGTLKRGTMKKGMEAELLGFNEKTKTTITNMQVFRKDVTVCEAGQNVGVIARNIKKDKLSRGMVLAEYRSTKLYNRFEAAIYFLTKEEGGRMKPLVSRFTNQILCDTWSSNVRMDLPDGIEMIMPGEQGTVNCTLVYRMPLEVGLSFTVRENFKTVLTGRITKLLPSVDVPKNKLKLVDFRRIVK